jgi:alkylation response protein AidB-like acyl-CoA dehydrogenase
MPAAATAVGDALAIAAPSVAGTAAPSGPLEVRVSGSWHWVPGAPHADWLVLSTPERDICVPAAIVQMTRVEHQGGLNGANLATVTMNDVRVPADHTVARGVDCATNAAPLGAIVGAAEGAFADYVTSTRKRVSATGGGAVAAHSQVQSRLAAAEAELDSAAALLARVLQELPLSTPKDHARLQRDGAVIAQRSLHVVTTLVHQMGALGLAEFNPVQRHYRDLRAMAVDPRVSADALIARGRELLGLPEPAATAAA